MNIAKIVVFGQADDVVYGMGQLSILNAFNDNTLIIGSNTWANDITLQRLVNEAGMSPKSVLSTFITRPTTGDFSLFGYCLSQIDQNYNPQYVIGYDANNLEILMPQSQFASFWQATFNCAISTSSSSTTCSATNQLNQVLTINVIIIKY